MERSRLYLLALFVTLVSAACPSRAPKKTTAAPPPAPIPRNLLETDHGAPISALAYAPDGNTIATSSEDGTIKLWSVEKGELLRTLAQGSASLILHFSPDGSGLLSSGAQGVSLWDVSSGDKRAHWPSKQASIVVHGFSTDGRWLAFAPNETSLLVVDARTGEATCTIQIESAIGGVIFRDENTTLRTSTSKGESVASWDVASCTKSTPTTIPGHHFNAITVSPDKRLVAIGGLEAIRIFDVQAQEIVQSIPNLAGTFVLANLRFVGNDMLLGNRLQLIKGATLEGAVIDTVLWGLGNHPHSGEIIWQKPASWGVDASLARENLAVAEGKNVRYLPLPKSELRKAELVVQTGHTRSVGDLALSPDSSMLLSADGESTILWDVGARRQLRRYSAPTQVVTFADEGKLAVAARLGGGILVWDTKSGRQLDILKSEHVAGMVAIVDANLVVSQDRSIWLYDLRRHSSTKLATTEPLSPIAVDSTGTRIAYVDGQRRLTVMKWGDPMVTRIPFTGSRLTSLAFGDDDTMIAGTLDNDTGTIALGWKVKTGREVMSLSTAEKFIPRGIEFHGDTAHLLGVGGISAWDWRGKKRLAHLDSSLFNSASEYNTPKTIAHSPSRELTAIGETNGTISFWSPTLVSLGSLRRHVQSVFAAVPTPDGNAVAIVDAGGKVIRWDPTSASVSTVLRQDVLQHPQSLAWTPKGDRLIVGMHDKIGIWDAESGKTIATQEALPGSKYSDGAMHSLEISGSGETLLASNRYALVLRKMADGSQMLHIDPTKLGFEKSEQRIFKGAAMSRDATTLALGVGFNAWLPRLDIPGAVVVWDVEKNAERHRLPHAGSVSAVAIDPFGKIIASSDWKMNLHLWNAESGELIAKWGADAAASLRFSSDGKLLASAGAGGSVTIWKVEEQASVAQVDVGAFVNSLRFTEDGKRLWVGAQDGVSTIVSVSEGAIVAQVAVSKSGGHITYTQDGYYWASQDALDAIAFRLGSRVLAADQLDLYFHRPDIVLERLGHQDKEMKRAFRSAHQRRLAKQGAPLLSDIAWEDVPTLSITSRKKSGRTSAVLDVDLKLTGTRDLRSVQAWVNGVPVYRVAGLKVPHARKASVQLSVPLLYGHNEVQFSVTDAAGVESFREVLSIDNSSGKAPKRQLRILAVGVSTYKERAYNLRYASKDARDFAAMFSEVGRFDEVETLVLTDSKAKRKAVLEQGRAFLAKGGLEDTVVVFMAGHGLRDKKLDYYFAGFDTDFDKPAAKGLSFADIEGLVDGLPARRRMILVDSCYAGELDPGAKAMPPPRKVGKVTVSGKRPRGVHITKATAMTSRSHRRSLDADFASLRRGTGAAVIASSSGYEVAFESKTWKNGAFTYSLLEGIRHKEADADKDEDISIEELRDYAATRVSELTDGLQVPVARHQNILLDFDLSKSVAPVQTLAINFSERWSSVALFPDLSTAVTAHKDGTIEFWDIAAKRIKKRLKGGAAEQGSLVLSPNSRYLVQVSEASNLLFDLRTGRKDVLGAPAQYTPSAVFDSSSAYVAVESGKGLRVHESANGKLISELATSVINYAFPSRNHVVDLSYLGLFRVNVLTGERKLLAASPKGARDQISEDGTRILSIKDEGVTLFAAEKMQALRRFDAGSFVKQAAISGDNSRLLVSTAKGDLRVWRTRDGRELTWLQVPKRFAAKTSLAAVGFASGGSHVYATASYEGLFIWQL